MIYLRQILLASEYFPYDPIIEDSAHPYPHQDLAHIPGLIVMISEFSEDDRHRKSMPMIYHIYYIDNIL